MFLKKWFPFFISSKLTSIPFWFFSLERKSLILSLETSSSFSPTIALISSTISSCCALFWGGCSCYCTNDWSISMSPSSLYCWLVLSCNTAALLLYETPLHVLKCRLRLSIRLKSLLHFEQTIQQRKRLTHEWRN